VQFGTGQARESRGWRVEDESDCDLDLVSAGIILLIFSWVTYASFSFSLGLACGG